MTIPLGDSRRFTFHDLDERTRAYMRDEMSLDLTGANPVSGLYVGARLTEAGRREWPKLVDEAFSAGDNESLAAQVRRPGLQVWTEPYQLNGVTRMRRVAQDVAARTLADGTFNRYYIRALCRRAMDDGTNDLVVYRARHSEHPRPESEARIGAHISAADLLLDLRQDPRIETALGVPAGPNSGLSVELAGTSTTRNR